MEYLQNLTDSGAKRFTDDMGVEAFLPKLMFAAGDLYDGLVSLWTGNYQDPNRARARQDKLSGGVTNTRRAQNVVDNQKRNEVVNGLAALYMEQEKAAAKLRRAEGELDLQEENIAKRQPSGGPALSPDLLQAYQSSFDAYYDVALYKTKRHQGSVFDLGFGKNFITHAKANQDPGIDLSFAKFNKDVTGKSYREFLKEKGKTSDDFLSMVNRDKYIPTGEDLYKYLKDDLFREYTFAQGETDTSKFTDGQLSKLGESSKRLNIGNFFDELGFFPWQSKGIPKGKLSVFNGRSDDDAFNLIDQKGIKAAIDPDNASGNVLAAIEGNSETSKKSGLIYRATGGNVPSSAAQAGMGMGTDTVPAMLTPGEFVVRKSSVDKYGTSFMNSLNSGTVQGLFEGGMPDEEKGKWKPAPHIPKKNYKRIDDNYTFQQAVQRGFIVPVEAADAAPKPPQKPAPAGGAAGGGAGIAPLIQQLKTTFTPLLAKIQKNQTILNTSVQDLIQINTQLVTVHEQIKTVSTNMSSAASRLSVSYDKLAEAMRTPLKVEAIHTHNIEGMISITNTGGIAEELGNALGAIIKDEVASTLPSLIDAHLNNKP
jgi:flagellin-like hook-associated protein FlgL